MKKNIIYDCIVIGGGAAGLFCSATFNAPINGLILEKTKHLGTKLLMSGSGQCNITHDGNIKDFVNCYGTNGGKIRGCLFKYNNQKLIEFLNNNGVETIIREDGKVFPKSMKSTDVQSMLVKKAIDNGFDIKYEVVVKSLKKIEDNWLVATSSGDFYGKNLIIATGGCSYPSSGSDGTMFKIIKRDLTLKINPLRPSLSPINVKNYKFGEISGISFKNVNVSLWLNNRKEHQITSDLLLTHKNFSGPAILNISKYATKNHTILVNYLYPCNKKEAMDKINSRKKNSKISISNLIISEFNLPKNFAKLICLLSKDNIKEVAGRLTEDKYEIESVEGFNKAMVTSGGIRLSDVNLTSMEISSNPGVFAIGEVLDIDGQTGGYNLQFAFSSAKGCSNEIIKRLGSKK